MRIHERMCESMCAHTCVCMCMNAVASMHVCVLLLYVYVSACVRCIRVRVPMHNTLWCIKSYARNGCCWTGTLAPAPVETSVESSHRSDHRKPGKARQFEQGETFAHRYTDGHHTHTHTYIHIHTHTHAHTRTHSLTHIHTLTHTQIHTQSPPPPCSELAIQAMCSGRRGASATFRTNTDGTT